MPREGKSHVLLFTSYLGGGGAEMQLVRMANHLDADRFRVSVVAMRGGGEYESLLRPGVRSHALDAGSIPATVRALRRLIRSERPDLVCSFLELPSAIALTSRLGLPNRPAVVACVQAPPSIPYSGPWTSRRRWFLAAISRLLPSADRIIAISHGVAEDVLRLAPECQPRLEVIFNAGTDADLHDMVNEPLPPDLARPDGPLVVACGRLNEQKGFPQLLDAFARVRQRVPAHLWIVGEGEQRPLLEARIRDLGLADSVRLLGFQRNPFKFMAAADVFALSSRYEGFGNVLVEAMACGTAVVSMDCPHGPSEIIQHGENGLLVPAGDVHGLADALARVLEDETLRSRLASCGRVRARDFAPSIIASQYEAAFGRALARRHDAEPAIAAAPRVATR